MDADKSTRRLVSRAISDARESPWGKGGSVNGHFDVYVGDQHVGVVTGYVIQRDPLEHPATPYFAWTNDGRAHRERVGQPGHGCRAADRARATRGAAASRRG